MKKLNSRGVTMIEVLAAIVIIGIVTAGILTVAVSSTQSALKTSQKENAVCNAQNIAELWQWHKRYYKLPSENPLLSSEANPGSFQFFSVTLAEKLYNLGYVDPEYDDPSIETSQHIKSTYKKDENGNPIENYTSVYVYTLYMDSDWNQMTIYDGEQGLATYRIEITQGDVFAGEQTEGNETNRIDGIESIIIRIYVQATNELIVEY